MGGKGKKKSRKRKNNPRELWIKEAIKKPGSLRAYVANKLGEKGFTNRGTLKVSELRRLLSGKYGDIATRTKQRIRLALRLRRF